MSLLSVLYPHRHFHGMLGGFLCDWRTGGAGWKEGKMPSAQIFTGIRLAGKTRAVQPITRPVARHAPTPRPPQGKEKTSGWACPTLRLASCCSHFSLFYLREQTTSSCCHCLSPSPRRPTQTLHRILGHKGGLGESPLFEPLSWGRINRR